MHHGHDVYFLVADGKGDEVINRIHIVDCGKPSSAFSRFGIVWNRMVEVVSDLKPDRIYYHDPELCIIAGRLLKMGAEVYYDAHEDSPRQYISNSRRNPLLAKVIAIGIEKLENKTAKRLAGMLSATKEIQRRFSQRNSNVVLVRNYPQLAEFSSGLPWSSRKKQAVYIGGLRETRGIREIIEACAQVDIPLKLAGPWQPATFRSEMEALVGWRNVEYLGFLDRTEVSNLLSESMIGLLMLHKTPNHMHSLPVKLFEYMAAGLPVVASSIPNWRGIIEGQMCGICIEPKDNAALTSAIFNLVESPEKMQEMGENGRSSVENQFSWSAEFARLYEQ